MTRLRTFYAASIVATVVGLSSPSEAQAQYSNVSVNCGAGRTAVIRQTDGGTRVDCVTATRNRSVAAKPKRSWQKSALMIGGAAGTGAGVGGLLDGKKGALIGAAIGGGSASIYEATRRR